jgi:F0F1-type ATP synthase membrane subunit b/b'
MMIIAINSLILLSTAIFAIVIAVISSTRVKEIKKEFKKRTQEIKKEIDLMKQSEKRHSDYLKNQMSKIANKLDIDWEELNDEIVNGNVVDINKHKCEGRS